MPDEYISPLGSLVNWIDSERDKNRKQEDSDMDQKIALIHDMITGPGANPARTADGIRSILELQQAKGGRQKGKRKAGLAGFMGANEELMPDFLSQLIHKNRPFQGPTYSEQQQEVSQPASVSRLPGQMDQQPSYGAANGIIEQPDEQISSAAISQQMGRGAPTGGQSVLQDPVMIPPPPLDAAPTGGRMLGAARDMQKQPQNVQMPGALGMQTTRTPLPDDQQPFMRSPEEMAQLEGNAAGIKENAIYDARNQAKVAMWKRAGLSDDEIRQMLLREATGAGAQLSIQDAGYVKVGDKVYHAVRKLNPRTGEWETVDQITGMPIPEGAIPVGAPSSSSETDPVSYKEWERAKAEAESRGQSFPGYEQWLTIDANRKRQAVNINNTTMPGTDLLYKQSAILNPIIARFQAYPAVKAVARMAPLEGVVRRIEANPNNAYAQLSEIYGFVGALDTYQSTVREGEVALTRETMSKVENLKRTIGGITNAKLLSPQAALGIARESRALMADIRRQAIDSAQMFRAQADVNGMAGEWDKFMSKSGIAGPASAGGGSGGAGAISPGAQAVLDFLGQP